MAGNATNQPPAHRRDGHSRASEPQCLVSPIHFLEAQDVYGFLLNLSLSQSKLEGHFGYCHWGSQCEYGQHRAEWRATPLGNFVGITPLSCLREQQGGREAQFANTEPMLGGSKPPGTLAPRDPVPPSDLQS